MKILCFGDSNTHGFDPNSYLGSQYPPQHRWVDLLAQKLNCAVVNAGENGREIPSREGELLRFELMLNNQKPLDLLVIMLGDNDLLKGNTTEAVVRRMERFLKSIDFARSGILLICPPPMQRGQWLLARDIIAASAGLNREYRALAQRLGVRFVDAGEWNVSIAFDGVHFTEDGHHAFARGLYECLAQADMSPEG